MLNIKPGDTVYYHNEWRNFKNSEILALFTLIDDEEGKRLSVGDGIWTNEEPYHPMGKVYGYTYNKILGIEANGSTIKFFMSAGGDDADQFLLWPASKLYRVTDQEKLEELIRTFPESRFL